MTSLVLLTICLATTHALGEKPTRDQIVQLSQTCKEQQKRMDLVAEFGTDLSGLDLSGVDFRGYYAVGYETRICNADFSNCNLSDAEFGSGNLDGSDFTGANLDGATFITARLKDTVLQSVSLKGTKFYQTDLSGTNLANADLSAADITGSDFTGANLSNANLSGANNEYWWTSFRNADLTNANLSGLPLNGAQFQNATLRSADLSNCELVQADFAGADLADASFKNSNVDAAVFRGASGLNADTKKELEQQAQRWKFELKTGITEFCKVAYFPSYLFVIVAVAGLSLPAVRRPQKSRLLVIAVCVNAVTIIPVCLMVCMFASGAHPTVQFNVGSPAAMQAWSAWVSLWPLLMLALLTCLVVSIVVAFVFVISHFRWKTLKQAKVRCLYLVLTIVHCLFAANWIGSNFPSA
jgi:uncharacterized protein YjbI with pentapeptide repeats